MKKTTILITLFVSLFLTAEMSSAARDVYSSNDILFYDPKDACSVTSASRTTSGGGLAKAVDYKNREIFSQDELKTIQENQKFYEKSAKKVGIPWQVIAVIHKREAGLRKENPSNGQGAYQFYEKAGGPYPQGPITDEEFQRQTDLVADFIIKTSGDRKEKLKSGDDRAVKFAFFAYSRQASAYVQQAKELGYSDEEAAAGEGSPYVMNKADAKRDPTANPNGWGQIKTSGGPISYPANDDYGAYVMYAALRGEIVVSGCGSAGDIHGDGLNEEQAKLLMMEYGDPKNGRVVIPALGGYINVSGCAGGPLSNCTAFSAFFNRMFTSSFYETGNGNQVVDNMRGDFSTGTEPRVFSTFSSSVRGDVNNWGHTGIVLGKKSDGSLIVGHANCLARGSGRGTGVEKRFAEGDGAGFITIGKPDDPSVWLAPSMDSIAYLKFSYPTKVDTAKIKQFIEGRL